MKEEKDKVGHSTKPPIQLEIWNIFIYVVYVPGNVHPKIKGIKIK